MGSYDNFSRCTKMTFQLRKSRRDPGSPICSNCCSVTYKQRWTLSIGHGQFRKFKTQRILKPGERWLCQAGHDQDEYEKVVSDEEKDGQEPQEPIVQRAKLVCSDYDSETESVVEELADDDNMRSPDLMTPKKNPYQLVDDWNNDWTPGIFDNADE